jgi:hypothetical protein
MLKQEFVGSWKELERGRRHVIKVLTPEDGDVCTTYDPSVEEDVAGAETLLAKQLESRGAAIAFHAEGATGEVVTDLDPTATMTVVIPRPVGG